MRECIYRKSSLLQLQLCTRWVSCCHGVYYAST
ncbi:hypothetical protein [Salmonella phage SD-1_S14]|nr:hypothetical protein [Salmonella phage SD-2_S15]WPK19827.1 hypothetical protein [Salmonella phage SD-1_S14]